MKIIFYFLIYIFIFIPFASYSFPIPKNNKAIFDIIRKNKEIGTHEILFNKKNEILTIETNIEIEVKLFFVTAYKYSHQSKELWENGNFVSIDAYTDFEDEREYFINGIKDEKFFVATGMDGEIKLDKDILPSNYWNIDVMYQKEIFDTQKGILRKLDVKELGKETIIINNKNIECKKFQLNASSNPKDIGPFPEYTLWYSENNELMKFKFKNWKDKKIVEIIRKQ